MVRAADQRASDADRDEVVELLRRAAGEGRIGHEELDERVAKALSAKTYRELNATVDDIPRQRGTRSRSVTARRGVATWAVTAVRREPWLLVLVIPALAVTFVLALTALAMFLVVAVAMLVLGGHHRRPAQLGCRPGRPPRGVRHVYRIASPYVRWI